ncbi:MAG: hypothetical protein AB8F74_20425 [Saprospiraceae bacterium]
MPKQQTDYLIQLVKSLTSAEKRFFRVYANRNNPSEDLLFLQLFDVLLKKKHYDQNYILEKIPGIKKRQLSNVKAHLYKQLLVALRLLHRNHNLDIELRERLDYARVLYNKGLYRQSLEELARAKNKALESHQYALALEVIEFEKLIESQHITRSRADRTEELTTASHRVSKLISRSHLFSNLALQLYGLYIKVGYVRNQKEFLFVREFFYSNLPSYDLQRLSFYEKLYLFQSYCWYHFMSQEFLPYYKYALRWVQLFEEDERMIAVERPLYLKGLHNLLNALFLLWQHDKFIKVLNKLENFAIDHKGKLGQNEEGILHLYLYINKINKHYIEGTSEEGLQLVGPLEKLIQQETYNWDTHRIMVFYYKIACLYFSSGDNENAIHYLNLIINEGYSDIREDIQCFARILCLIAHFELGSQSLVQYQVKSVYRFLRKREDLHRVQEEVLKFVRKIPSMTPVSLKAEFASLRDSLKKIQKDPFEKRPFLYLDIISWLESKLRGITVQEVLREKFLTGETPLG